MPILGHSDHERAVPAGGDQQFGLLATHGHERVVAVQLVQRPACRLRKIAVVVMSDEMRDHLGVRVRPERRAVSEQPTSQLDVVLDDAVEHDVDAPRGVTVWMRVGLADTAVGGPAGVTNAGGGCLGNARPWKARTGGRERRRERALGDFRAQRR